MMVTSLLNVQNLEDIVVNGVTMFEEMITGTIAQIVSKVFKEWLLLYQILWFTIQM